MVVLTFDIEEHFHSSYAASDSPRHWALHDCIARIVDYLITVKRKATFFVVGELAEKYSSLIRRMSDNDFEIGSHSYSHLLLDRTKKNLCKENIRRSKNVIENITGKPVYGYRAPSWSAVIKDTWLWEHLATLRFRYDSSLFPFKTTLYGSPEISIKPFQVYPGLIEIPPSVYRLGRLRIPFGGGFYFRLYPTWLTRFFIAQNQKKKNTPMLYYHPWEFQKNRQTLERDILKKIIGNYHVTGNWHKFTKFLLRYETTTMWELYTSITDGTKETKAKKPYYS